MENSHSIEIKIHEVEEKSGLSKEGKKYGAKILYGTTTPESAFKSNLKVKTMAFGKGGAIPDNFNIHDVVVMDIDSLSIDKRCVDVRGVVMENYCQ